MRFAVVGLLALNIASSVTANQTLPKAPAELLSGYSKGYATDISITPGVLTFSRNGKVILTLYGATAQKWLEYRAPLGPCYAQDPAVSLSDKKGRQGTVYRFRDGAIIAGPAGTWMLTSRAVREWEILGGVNGKLGWPKTDTQNFILPKNQGRLT